MSSSIFLQQSSMYLARLTWMICVMRGKWPYRCNFAGCCFQDLFKTARSIIFTPLYAFRYSYLILIIIGLQVIISI